MPLTPFQRTVLRLLARNRSPDSYLAGGAALHFAPNSHRFTDSGMHLDPAVRPFVHPFVQRRVDSRTGLRIFLITS